MQDTPTDSPEVSHTAVKDTAVKHIDGQNGAAPDTLAPDGIVPDHEAQREPQTPPPAEREPETPPEVVDPPAPEHHDPVPDREEDQAGQLPDEVDAEPKNHLDNAPATTAAEQFAGEMNAEPKDLDGEPGFATPEEQAAAESLGEEAPETQAAAEASPDPPIPEAAAEEIDREAEQFAGEMNAEPKELDGEPGLATPEEQAAAESLGEEAIGQESPDQESPDGQTATAETHTGEAQSAEPVDRFSQPATPRDSEALSPDEILGPDRRRGSEVRWPAEDAELMAMLEAVIYITDEPLSLDQITNALGQSRDRIKRLLDELVAEWLKPQHGLAIREVAGGYKMATKPEHHDAVRQFVKSLKPPMKLSLPALETLAVIAYKQPCTGPEIMEIRGVQGASVLKTLIDRKLIAPAGRKNVIGKPILYKTTKEFLVQFGLKDLSELPSVKEFEELARFAVDSDRAPEPAAAEPQPSRSEPAQPEPADAAVHGEPEQEEQPEQPSPAEKESIGEPVAE